MLAHRNPVPRSHRHCRNTVLRAAINQPVGIDQIHQRIPPCIDHAHHAQVLEEDGGFLGEHLFLFGQGREKFEIPNLPAGYGGFGFVFSKAEGPGNATRFCTREIAGNTLHGQSDLPSISGTP
jgi:hypothetical protein